MKESDLYKPVKAWLQLMGYTVYPEVPCLQRTVDVVGIKPDHIIGVEMKLSMTHGVLYQGHILQMACDKVFVAVSTKPRNLERAKKLGLGVLRVTGRKVDVLVEPSNEREIVDGYYKILRETCSVMSTRGIGGVPNLDGVGPAQDCKRRVDKYREKHPKATWKEIYRKVPNHYASHASMRHALTTGMELRAHWKKIRKKMRDEKRRKERENARNQRES